MFPGSRLHEVHTNTPVLLKAAHLLRAAAPGRRFVMSAASGRAGDWVERCVCNSAPENLLVTRDTFSALAASDVALLCSGSITLEAALLGIPMVVFYRGTFGMWLQYSLFYRRRLRFIAMPNLIAQRQVVPELLGEAATAEALAQAASGLLEDRARREEMLAGLREVAELLGPPGAVGKTAALALRMAEGTDG